MSGMKVLEDVDTNTLLMSMSGTGCPTRHKDEINADSYVALKMYKASKLFTSTLGIENANEPEELTTHVLEMLTKHHHADASFQFVPLKDETEAFKHDMCDTHVDKGQRPRPQVFTGYVAAPEADAPFVVCSENQR